MHIVGIGFQLNNLNISHILVNRVVAPSLDDSCVWFWLYLCFKQITIICVPKFNKIRWVIYLQYSPKSTLSQWDFASSQ